MESKWLQGRKETLENYKNGVKKKSKIIAIIMTIVAVILLLASYSSIPEEGKVSAIVVIGMTYGIVLLITLASPLKIKKLNVGEVEAALKQYLRTPEDVQAFEREVAAPRVEIEVGGGLNHRKVKVTANWVVVEDVGYVTNDKVFRKEELLSIYGARIDRTQFNLEVGNENKKILAYFGSLDKKDYFKLLQFFLDHFPEAEWQAYTKGMPGNEVS